MRWDVIEDKKEGKMTPPPHPPVLKRSKQVSLVEELREGAMEGARRKAGGGMCGPWLRLVRVA